jgi:hypothetical protein
MGAHHFKHDHTVRFLIELPAYGSIRLARSHALDGAHADELQAAAQHRIRGSAQHEA